MKYLFSLCLAITAFSAAACVYTSKQPATPICPCSCNNCTCKFCQSGCACGCACDLCNRK